MTARTLTSKVEFFLPLKPRATQRSRCACRGRFPSVYTDPAYREWKEQAIALLNAMDRAELPDFVSEDPDLSVGLTVVVKKPKTTKLKRPRGDRDNYEKGVFDALTQSGWWKDDDQIVSGPFRKRWAAPGEPEGYHITIERED